MAMSSVDSRHAPFRLLVRRSRIHGRGVFAAQRIPRGRKVIEYTGERVSFAEARRRWNPRLNYLFALKDSVIDGLVGGSGAEYVNHCCAPNLKARLVRGHLLFYSLRAIGKDEELTLDYKYRTGKREDHPCACGARSCRGSIILDRRETRRRQAPRQP